eukprot:3258942-Alexandrium_andersonii.AAC.1
MHGATQPPATRKRSSPQQRNGDAQGPTGARCQPPARANAETSCATRAPPGSGCRAYRRRRGRHPTN